MEIKRKTIEINRRPEGIGIAQFNHLVIIRGEQKYKLNPVQRLGNYDSGDP